jgi:hypothetical protein
MNLRNLSFEQALVLLAFLFAVGLRFFSLGASPLSDTEASWALQALKIARGLNPGETLVLGPQPAYVMLTSILFSLLSSTNFLARFWPALSGSLMVFLPFFFSRDLQRINAPRFSGVIFAFGIALDPGLVALSRQAGSPIMAVALLLLGIGLWRSKKPALSGIALGLALLSGPAVLTGMLSLALAYGLSWLLASRSSPNYRQGESNDPDQTTENQKSSLRALLSAGGTILLASTLFLRFPEGLAAWIDTLSTYLQGWVSSSGVPVLRVLIALFVFQPFALIFTAAGIPHGLSNNRLGRRIYTTILFWTIIALLFALLYPSRQVEDLAWVLVPVWVLAAIKLSDYFSIPENPLIAVSQAVLVFFLFALFWLTLAGLARTVPGAEELSARLGIMIGIIALGGLTTVLISLGWTWSTARNGLVWGASAAFGAFLFSALWGASQLRPNQPEELWGFGPGTGQVNLFSETLGDLSEWHTGFRQQIDILSETNAPSLRWVLRDYTNVRFDTEPTTGDLPSIIITPQAQQPPALTSAYRGQDFVWWISPGWSGALPPNIPLWIVSRQAPVQQDRLILWARADIFPSAAAATQEDSSIQPK